LYSRYSAEYPPSSGIWQDRSGNSLDATTAGTTIPQITDTVTGHKHIQGTSAQSIDLSVGMPASGAYTLFHRARYVSGETSGRIFQGKTCNWFSGYHGARSGVAFHQHFITGSSTTSASQTDRHGYAWVVSTDQKDLYRSNGEDRSTRSGNSQCGLTVNNVNAGSSQTGNQYGSFAISEVLVFDRELNATEILQVESCFSPPRQYP
jgi:hypothetical protein